MTVKTGQVWAGVFTTLGTNGGLLAGSPSGTLYVNGTSNGATVTITGSNPYKWSVTLPSLTAGQRVDMYITATIGGTVTAGIVASDQADTTLLSDGVVVNSGTVTNLTNLPAIPNDWLTAAGVKADAVTKIATGVWASATRTLSSFGTLVADIWASATRTLSSFGFTVATNSDANVTAIKAKTDLITTGTSLTIASVVVGSTITAHRGDTLSAALENIGALTNYSKLWFTVKRDYDDADTAAVIQIEKTGGLLYLNGAVGTAGNGSLTINDEATGDVTIVLNASETAKLSPGNYQYDIQILRSAGTPVSTLTYGEFVVPADVTRATS